MRRFWLAVLAGALVLGVAFRRLPSGSPQLTIAIVVLAALGTGFFAGRRGVLAGLLMVYLGNLLFVVLTAAEYGVGQDDPSGVGGFIGRLLIVQVVLLQFAIPAAIAGWCGAYARQRFVGTPR